MRRQGFAIVIDGDDPLPLYHQIAVALQYRIATGRLEEGTRLPPLREAARLWDVNYHTVRRAYGVLKEMGLVESRRGIGTIVTAGRDASGATDATLDTFLDSVSQEARDRFGLSGPQLAGLLGARHPESRERSSHSDAVVVECNAHQCGDLASQIRARYALLLREHVLGSVGAPPPGPLIGTQFHRAEMHRSWPARRKDMRFAAILPEPTLARRLASFEPAEGALEVPLCEREPSLAAAMAEDVQRMVPDSLVIVPRIDSSPEELLDSYPDRPVLFAPRIWNDLRPALRRREEAIEVRYVFRERDLAVLADEFGWRRLADGVGDGETC